MGQLKEYIFLALKSYIHLDLSSVCELLLGRVAVHSSSTAVSKTFLQKSFKVNLQRGSACPSAEARRPVQEQS